jgi:type IV secretion system protein VirB3
MTLTIDPVFLGATRPAELWGTHWGAVVGNVVVTLYGYVLSDHETALGLFVPLHALAWLLSRHDPNAFRLLGLYLRFRLKALSTVHRWSAASTGPWPARIY